MGKLGKILAATALVGGVALAGPASAEVLFPGQWDLGGFQSICIQPNGTWYSPTFSGWAGEYTFDARAMVLFGNFSGGFGNDVIEIIGPRRGGGKSDWTEWLDDFSFANFVDDVEWSFEKSVCDPPAVTAHAHSAHPAPNKK